MRWAATLGSPPTPSRALLPDVGIEIPNCATRTRLQLRRCAVGWRRAYRIQAVVAQALDSTVNVPGLRRHPVVRGIRGSRPAVVWLYECASLRNTIEDIEAARCQCRTDFITDICESWLAVSRSVQGRRAHVQDWGPCALLSRRRDGVSRSRGFSVSRPEQSSKSSWSVATKMDDPKYG
jgi:hypothetical protein